MKTIFAQEVDGTQYYAVVSIYFKGDIGRVKIDDITDEKLAYDSEERAFVMYTTGQTPEEAEENDRKMKGL